MPLKGYSPNETIRGKIRSKLMGNQNGILPEGKWSRHYDSCVSCKRNNIPFEAKGLCEKCYPRIFARKNRSPKKKTTTGFLYSDATRPQSQSCDICGKICKTMLDHCHAKNKFRGWLCNHCNLMLGQVKDNIDMLNRMISYLSKD